MSHLGPQPKSDPDSKKRVLEAALKADEREIRHLVDVERIPIESTNEIGQTAAHIAAANGNLPVLQYLLFREPSLVATTDRWKQTPLHLAVERGALDVVEYLIDHHNADISQRCGLRAGNNALHIAAVAGQLAVLRYLIETKSMDPNEKNDEGQTATLLAARVDHLHIIQYLTENANANLTAIDNNGQNILFMSAKVLYGSLRVPTYVMDEKKFPIDINWRDHRGFTVTHFACKFFHFPTIKYYVDMKRANINIPDNRNRTALHLASSLGNLRLVEYLVYHGIDLRVKDVTGKTALNVATDPSIVQFLEENMMKRTRRSLVQGPQFKLVSFLKQQQQQLMPLVYAEERSISRTSTHLDEDRYPQLVDSGVLSRANNILFLANAFFKHNPSWNMLSRQQVMSSRVDPIAIEVIHSDSFS